MREPTERRKLHSFLTALGRAMHHQLRLYLVGGAVMVDTGLRAMTMDIDYAVSADDPSATAEFEQLIPQLKRQLNVSVEPASPADFMPVRQGALEKSRYVRQYGPVSVYYYDPVSLVLAKIARGAERDLTDVESLVGAGLVDWDDVEQAWTEVKANPRGWLRYVPEEIEPRLNFMRRQLGKEAPIQGESPSQNPSSADLSGTLPPTGPGRSAKPQRRERPFRDSRERGKKP